MKRTIMIVASVAVAACLGIAGGAAIASAPALLSPAGVHAGTGIASAPKAAPSYPANQKGETYGSALDAISPDTEPDLIQAVASNGREGYVRKADLDQADGSAAAKSFKSPADALAWQRSSGATDHAVNVYAKDGVTVVGTFLVAGLATQEAGATEQGTK